MKESSTLLPKTRQQMNGRVAELEKEKSALSSELRIKKAALAKLFLHSESFTLTKGTAKTFGKYDLTLGFVNNESTTSIEVNFNSEPVVMEVGEVLEATVDGKQCKIVLEKYEFFGSEADFSFVVQDQ